MLSKTRVILLSAVREELNILQIRMEAVMERLDAGEVGKELNPNNINHWDLKEISSDFQAILQ